MGNDISIQVNGQAKVWQSDRTVADLLRDLDIRDDRVAVELNLEILDRADFGTRSLCAGDRVEILSFIGGGAGSPMPVERGLRRQVERCQALIGS